MYILYREIYNQYWIISISFLHLKNIFSVGHRSFLDLRFYFIEGYRVISFTTITCFPLKINSIDWLIDCWQWKWKRWFMLILEKWVGKLLLRFIVKLHGVHSESRVFFFMLGSKYQAPRHLRESNPSERSTWNREYPRWGSQRTRQNCRKWAPATSSASQGWERGSCNTSKDNCSKSGVWGESDSIQSTGRGW